MLRAKFRVDSITYHKASDGQTEQEQIRLTAVYSDDPESENAKWSRWTPSGVLEMTITNPDAFGKVSNGHEFFVDLTPA